MQPRNLQLVFGAFLWAACGSESFQAAPSPATDAGAPAAPEDSGLPVALDAAVPPPATPDAADAGVVDPVVFVHGVNGSSADFDALVAHLVAAGWPAERLFPHTFPDPQWGCNTSNAALVATWVDEAMAKSGATRVDLVAHSMGGLSSRHFVKVLGGAAKVATFVTLGTMHHGLPSPCLSPLPVCVWKELCQSGEFIGALDVPPVTPGPARWVSIFSVDDGTVPTESSRLDGAENVQVAGIPHSGDGGLLSAPLTMAEVAREIALP